MLKKALSMRKPCEGGVVDRVIITCVPRVSSNLSPIPCHDLKAHSLGKPFDPTALKPSPKILALAHVKSIKLVAAFHDGLHPDTGYPHAPSD